MKNIYLLFIFVIPYSASSQFSKPQAFLQFNLFYDDELEDTNAYLKLNAGAELFSYKFMAPEFDISYYDGSSKEKKSNSFGEVFYKSSLNSRFNGFIWGFSPKLFYQEEESRWVFIPKYHFGKIKAESFFSDSNDFAINKEKIEKINFWSFAVGIETEALLDNGRIGFYLMYSGFNAGIVLNQLDFSEQGFSKSDYNTKTIGLGIRISTNFKKKKEF